MLCLHPAMLLNRAAVIIAAALYSAAMNKLQDSAQDKHAVYSIVLNSGIAQVYAYVYASSVIVVKHKVTHLKCRAINNRSPQN